MERVHVGDKHKYLPGIVHCDRCVTVTIPAGDPKPLSNTGTYDGIKRSENTR
jgi:hypothetical protein